MNPSTSSAAATGLAENPAERQLTEPELERARVFLLQTRCYVVGATKGLSDAQWHFKPAPGAWSIAETVHHMVVVMDLVLGPIRQQLAAAPPPSPAFDYKQVDEIVFHQVSVRLQKFPGPPAVHPVGQLAPAIALDRLLNGYERLSEYLESTPDLRQHVRDAPPIKAISKGVFESIDGYQWILTAAAHNERHTKQILEVKADPNFPE
jgi:hypothetical protein